MALAEYDMKTLPPCWMTAGPSLTLNPIVSQDSVGWEISAGVPWMVQGLAIFATNRLVLLFSAGLRWAQER